MSTWPARRPWERFPTADLVEAIAIIERRPVDTFAARTVAALRAELALRDPNGPAPDSAGQGLAERAAASAQIESTP